MVFTLFGQQTSVFGVLAVLECIFILVFLKREKILKMKLLSHALWIGHYLLCGAQTAAILNIIGVGRAVVYYYRGKKKFASLPFWLPLFILLTLISPMNDFVRHGGFYWLPVIPMIGSMLSVISFYQKNPQVTRCISFAEGLLWLFYGIFSRDTMVIIANSLMLLSAIIGTIRELLARKKEKQAGMAKENA